jgi:hypothetical protein
MKTDKWSVYFHHFLAHTDVLWDITLKGLAYTKKFQMIRQLILFLSVPDCQTFF